MDRKIASRKNFAFSNKLNLKQNGAEIICDHHFCDKIINALEIPFAVWWLLGCLSERMALTALYSNHGCSLFYKDNLPCV